MSNSNGNQANLPDDVVAFIREAVEERIAFNKVLGMRVVSLDARGPCVRFDMRDGLIGNWTLGTLHGGAISAVLDAVGGLTVGLDIASRIPAESLDTVMRRFQRIGTIDLRVDFLRPGRGAYFVASGAIMRTGKKVAVARMELHNDRELLIAVGTGTYIVG